MVRMRDQVMRLQDGLSMLARRAENEGPMSEFSSDLMRLLDERGHIYQQTDVAGLDALAGKESLPGYIGFDCTAPCLHVGSLVQIMTLRRMQRTGHKPIVIMGGGTTKIGDPSDKTEARPMLDDATIATNKQSLMRIFERFLTFGDGPTDAIMVDNADWLDKLEYIPFLRDVGRHFSINRMLTLESVKQRLDREQSLSFLAGIDVTRRMEGAELFGVTSPLVTTADGAKMGKTVGGAVWLHEDFLPDYDFWQYWRNTDDRDVGRFLRLFTELPLDEIERLEALPGAEINHAKIVLANEVTTLARSEAAAHSAEATATATFAGGGMGEDLPVLEVAAAGITVGAACTALGFTASNGEAKRKVAEGAVRIDDAPMTDAAMLIQLASGEERKLSLGRKRHAVLRGV
jgi:tyrosyl-tRNA synthetase